MSDRSTNRIQSALVIGGILSILLTMIVDLATRPERGELVAAHPSSLSSRAASDSSTLRPFDFSTPLSCQRVIDGDTIVLDSGEHVRLIDRDCFEIRRGARLDRQAKAAGITPDEALARGKAQAAELKAAIEGKPIKLRFATKPARDRWGRLRAELLGLADEPANQPGEEPALERP